MVEDEDSTVLRFRLQRWKSIEVVFRWGYILGFVAALVMLVLVLLEDMPFSWFGIFLFAVWVPVQAVWAIAKSRVDKLGDRLHQAEFMEKFRAISSKYQNRILNVGKRD